MDELLEIVRRQLGIFSLSPRARFMADLGAESLDLLRLAAAVEDHFQVVLPEEGLAEVQTVKDLHDLLENSLKDE